MFLSVIINDPKDDNPATPVFGSPFQHNSDHIWREDPFQNFVMIKLPSDIYWNLYGMTV